MSLRLRLILRLSLGTLVFAAVLFVPADTWRFWQAWTVLAVAFTYSARAFLYFYKHDRELVERRLRSTETPGAVVEAGLLCGFPSSRLRLPSGLVTFPAGLSASAALADLPSPCSVRFTPDLLGVQSQPFVSRTIEVETGQRVVSSGPYEVVRHPMYSASLLIWP